MKMKPNKSPSLILEACGLNGAVISDRVCLCMGDGGDDGGLLDAILCLCLRAFSAIEYTPYSCIGNFSVSWNVRFLSQTL